MTENNKTNNANKYSFVADKIQTLPFSGIRKFFDVAAQMKDVVSLGVGEPDFETPWNIREQAIYHIENHRTVYTSNAGTSELREEISLYMRRFSLDYNPKTEVLVTVGASEGIDVALRALINPGDEVVYVEPCFVSYRPCIIMAGGVPVPVATRAENDFRLMPDELERVITPKTKVLLFSYPNNPTGAIMNGDDLKKIADVLKDKQIAVISDEIYAELTYGDRKHTSIASFEHMRNRTVVLNGFSKAFAMTGWRLGFACAPPDILSAMLKIHQYIIMCAATTTQFAGIEALKNSMDSVEHMRKAFDARRRFMLDGFKKIGIPCFEPLGAFYLFPSIQKTGMTSDEFCTKMLYEEKVAVVPGTAFGECGEGFIRCSYAYSIEALTNALHRIGRFIEKQR